MVEGSGIAKEYANIIKDLLKKVGGQPSQNSTR